MSAGLRIVDWFIPERARRSQSDLGRARTFVFTHLVGPTTGISIVLFLIMADPSPGLEVALIAAGIASFWVLALLLRATGDLKLVAIASVQSLIAVTLYGVYHYGGVSSPFLPWLLIALANGFFYLNDRPVSVLVVFITNVGAFILYWHFNGAPPPRVPMEKMSGVGIVSVSSATLYMAWLSIYYGQLLTSESALEREALRHRETAKKLVDARDKAEAASREKSIFLAKMSHELRTPLNAVIGYAEILQEDAENCADAQRSNDLSRISAAGKHLLALVTDILDIGRIESNELELQIERFEINDLVKDVVATASPLIAQNGNTLSVNIAPGIGAMVSDELRLRQAVLNLLSNAAKFTSKGQVVLSVNRYRAESGDWVEIEVRDTGLGISPEDLSKLFKDFSQLNAPAARKKKGTGLGLALSRKLITMMGGDIFAESQFGHGACFTIRVPASLKPGPERNRSKVEHDSSAVAAVAAEPA
ncbi:MAG: ATP-binding protein [Methylocystis sp.]|nr:ATP-binding protein [Methylocystis sp.]